MKDAMVGFLEDVTTATGGVIDEVEAVGIPDVEDGQAAADTVLTALRNSRDVFEDASDRVQGLSTADPSAFAEELQTLGSDIQSSMSGIGGELDRFASPELDEASKDIPECPRGGRGGVGTAGQSGAGGLVYWCDNCIRGCTGFEQGGYRLGEAGRDPESRKTPDQHKRQR